MREGMQQIVQHVFKIDAVYAGFLPAIVAVMTREMIFAIFADDRSLAHE